MLQTTKSIELRVMSETKGSFVCVVCDITVPSSKQLEQHLLGKKHMRKVAKVVCTPLTTADAGVTAGDAKAGRFLLSLSLANQ